MIHLKAYYRKSEIGENGPGLSWMQTTVLFFGLSSLNIAE